jgi:hypothetical protein
LALSAAAAFQDQEEEDSEAQAREPSILMLHRALLSVARRRATHTTYDAHKPPVANDQQLRDLVIVHPRDDLVDCGCFVHAHGIARHDSIHPQGLHALAYEPTFSFPSSHSNKNPAGQLTSSSRR